MYYIYLPSKQASYERFRWSTLEPHTFAYLFKYLPQDQSDKVCERLSTNLQARHSDGAKEGEMERVMSVMYKRVLDTLETSEIRRLLAAQEFQRTWEEEGREDAREEQAKLWAEEEADRDWALEVEERLRDWGEENEKALPGEGNDCEMMDKYGYEMMGDVCELGESGCERMDDYGCEMMGDGSEMKEGYERMEGYVHEMMDEEVQL